MKTVYIYVLDTLADWEIGYLTAEVNSRRFFKMDAEEIQIRFVSDTKESIKTMGGITITPDTLVEEIEINENSYLVLPGADTWSDRKHDKVVEKAKTLLDNKGHVAAICGATVALANNGILDDKDHTSNGEGFLEIFSKDYKGTNHYKNEKAVFYGQLITAGSTGGLLWTKYILKKLDVLEADTLEYWYDYFSTGDASHFYKLIETLSR